MVRRWARLVVGLAIGACLAVVELLYVAVRWPRSWAVALAEVERRRLARWHDVESSSDYDHRAAVKYLALRSLVGLLGGGTLVVLAYGFGAAAMGVWQLTDGVMQPLQLLAVVPLGLVLLYLAIQGLVGVTALEKSLALRYLGPSEQELLRRRITELSLSRAGVVEAVDAERRRIERDLHDGVQQRIVALAMLLGRTRRRPVDDRDDLLAQAHDEAQEILNDLRDVAWRVYPTVLDNLGLAEVLAGVAERAGIPVKLSFTVPDRLPAQLETVAYFVASEAVTNAAKHSRADLVTIEVAGHENMVIVRITDNGIGGADTTGSGLSGLARRVAALDGRFTVTSPDGGPTVVTAELPCG
ncbi:histidine kinase [Kibdelosporangium philippinense]|uniref:histidine kinase n=2 Tax=Kibdelosporangium philippinense TaxID=211113 RepID=A0ABS8ZFG3_9PSEU|nr:histidine kinase [Kibdelosporangium philippinense]MCE7006515.1 histidine kinase [Kibdelosporangium philippinense]